MEASPQIYSTIAEVMRKVNAISKGRKNQQQNFNFRGIDDVMNELHPVMAECGLFVVPTVEKEERSQGQTSRGGAMFYTRLTIRFTFYAQDGSSLDAVVIGEAMDTADKASNKALSVGLKYALLQVFCIPTEDDKDPDASSPNFEAMSPEAKIERRKDQRSQAPAGMKPAAQLLAGGPDTEEERNRINQLLKEVGPTGAPVFEKNFFQKIPVMRQGMTAQEVIRMMEDTCRQVQTPTQDQVIDEKTEADVAAIF